MNSLLKFKATTFPPSRVLKHSLPLLSSYTVASEEVSVNSQGLSSS